VRVDRRCCALAPIQPLGPRVYITGSEEQKQVFLDLFMKNLMPGLPVQRSQKSSAWPSCAMLAASELSWTGKLDIPLQMHLPGFD
jgi:hypothetical protein